MNANTSRISSQTCSPLNCPRLGLFLLLLVCWGAMPAKAQLVTNIIYQDMFSTVGSLNGRTPDTVDSGTNTWIANSDWMTDGAEATEEGAVSCGFLPFIPLPGRVYTLSADLEDEVPGSAWTALGFTANATVNAAYIATDLNAVGWQLSRDAGDASPEQCFIGPNTLGSFVENGFYSSGLTNYAIVLDTTPTNAADWTFTFLIGGTVARATQAFGTPAGEPNGPVINYVAIGNGNGSDISLVQDFTLTEQVASNQRPFIVESPQPPLQGTNFVGDTVTLNVLADGYPGPFYQWQMDSTNIAGATASALTLSDVALTSAGSYAVVVSNSVGSVTSAPVQLHVVTPVTYVFYEDTFSGAGPLNGRTPDTAGAPNKWYASPTWTVQGNEATASGDSTGPNAFLPFTPSPGSVCVLSALLDDAPGGSTWEAIGYAQGDATNGWLTSAVNPVGWMLAGADDSAQASQAFIGPITTGGYTFGFSTGPATYTTILDTRPAQPGNWTFSFQNNGQTLVPPTPFGGTGPSISYVGLADFGIDSVTAQDFTLTVLSAPLKPYFATLPQGGTYYVGQTATFSPSVGGSPLLTYQWQLNSTNIPGANNVSLTVSNLVLTNSGSYQLVVSNTLGSVTSAPTVLIVATAPTSVNSSSNLVLELKFDGNYLDSSGHGNNATSVGSTIVPGIIGSGAMTYGNNGSFNDLGYATLGSPTSSNLLFSNNVNFSLSYWIQYTNVSDNVNGSYFFPSCDLPIIGNAVNSTYQQGWVIAQGGEGCEGNPGAFFWSLSDGSARPVLATGPSHSEDDGNWHHLVHVFDWGQGYGTTYLDGAQVDSTYIDTLATVDNTNAITMGSDPTGAYFSPGAANLDDLCIWRRALSANEARAIYEAGISNHVGVASAPQPITAQISGGQLTLTWSEGILQSAGSLAGPWTAVPNAAPPVYSTPATAAQQYYRAAQ
jgi:hypothetical protein